MPPRGRTRKRDAILPEAQAGLDADLQIALLAERTITEQLTRILDIPYETFCSIMLGITLTPGQRAITRVLFDGKAPPPEFEAVFGGLAAAPDPFALRTAVAILGRGSGKTRCVCAARSVHLALVADCSGLPMSETALVAIVAPKIAHSRHTLSFVKGFFIERPILRKVLKVDLTIDAVRLVRPDGRKVSIEARAASSGGDSVRGPSLAGVFLDEAAFFYGDGFEVNDGEIFRAARPRLLPRGQILFASTPWAQEGKLWELYRDNFGKPDSAIVCQAPTLVIRPSEDTKRAYEAEMKTDPDNARREYDAQFLSADSERFFPENVILKALDESLIVPQTVKHGESVRFGGDFGFVNDSAALFGFVDRGDKYVTCELDEQRPAENVPLVPSQVVNRFADIMKRCGAKLLIADDHYRQSVEEHLAHSHIALASVGQTPAHSFVLARTLMAQGRVSIPANPRLLAQLRRVRATIKPGGLISIHQPRAKEGGHGDIVSAMVCALSGVDLAATFPKPEPKDERERLTLQAKEEQGKRLKGNEDRLKRGNRDTINRIKKVIGNRGWRALTR